MSDSADMSDSSAPSTMGPFDYIIVGSGPSAMGLLHGLLQSTNATHAPTIALIERGTSDMDPLTRPLNRWFAASHDARCRNTSLTTGYLTVSSSWHRLVDVAVGVGLGGSSLINAGLVIPPAAADFAEWPVSIAAQMAPAVSTLVDAMHAHDCIQSSLEAATMASTLSDVGTTLPLVENTHIRSSGESGLSHTTRRSSGPSVNPWKETHCPSCCVHVPCAARPTLERASYYDSLLRPILDAHPKLMQQHKLTMFTGYTAERLLFLEPAVRTPRCTGVEVHDAVTGRSWHMLGHEVILCAGAVESPALLLASGIGRDGDVRALGVEPICVADATAQPYVGGNLRDHVLVPRIFVTRPRRTSQPLALNGVRAVANLCLDTTKAQVSLMDAAAYTDLIPRLVAATVRFRIVPGETWSHRVVNVVLDRVYHGLERVLYLLMVYTPLYFVLRYCIVTMAVFVMNGESVGRLHVTRRRLGDVCRRSDLDVQVELNYLQRDEDVQRMMVAWEAGTRVAYSQLPGVDLFPGPLVRTGLGYSSPLHRGRFAWFARAMVRPYFHWMGTCAMQTTRRATTDWVVDATFRVRNVESLRVCDASVLPTLISSPPALTCAALGYILASQLKESKATEATL